MSKKGFYKQNSHLFPVVCSKVKIIFRGRFIHNRLALAITPNQNKAGLQSLGYPLRNEHEIM
jgi:hypothetical protein